MTMADADLLTYKWSGLMDQVISVQRAADELGVQASYVLDLRDLAMRQAEQIEALQVRVKARTDESAIAVLQEEISQLRGELERARQHRMRVEINAQDLDAAHKEIEDLRANQITDRAVRRMLLTKISQLREALAASNEQLEQVRRVMGEQP